MSRFFWDDPKLLLSLWFLSNFPGRADPDCMLGQLLKMLIMNDDFTNAVRTVRRRLKRENIHEI